MANPTDYGLYLGSTQLFDVARLQSTDVKSAEFKELIVRLAQNVNSILLAVNNKESSLYSLTEFINSQTFFSDPAAAITPSNPLNRQVFRKVINFGPLVNNAEKAVAHGIAFTNTFTITRMYGAASDTTNLVYLPLPYASPTLADNIELRANNTNVYVRAGNSATNRSNFNRCYIIIEYIKS